MTTIRMDFEVEQPMPVVVTESILVSKNVFPYKSSNRVDKRLSE
jgi:hypothetical protein